MTVMATMGFLEFMSVLGLGVILAFAIGAIAWLGYCISHQSHVRRSTMEVRRGSRN